MSDERELKRLLDLAVGQEPPLRLDPDAVLGEGKRRLRARRATAVGGAATAVVAMVIGVAAVSGSTFGMPEQVGPAGSVTVEPPRTAAPSATSPPPTSPPGPTLTTSPAVPVSTTTTKRPSATVFGPEAARRLGVELRDGEVEWPAVAKVGYARPWYSFDKNGMARFDLVTADAVRRTVVVVVHAGSAYKSQLCVSSDTGPPCESWQLDDGTLMTMTLTEGSDSSSTFLLHAMRPDGVVVSVTDTGGLGPRWRLTPLLDQTAMVQIATLPGLAGK